MQNSTEIMNSGVSSSLFFALILLAALTITFFVFALYFFREKTKYEALFSEKNIEVNNLKIEIAGNLAKNDAIKSELLEKERHILEVEKKLSLTFENMSHKIFNEYQNSFIAKSGENIENLLNPVKEKFEEFKKSVSEKYKDEHDQRIRLETEIKRIENLNLEISENAKNLTNALKNNHKSQGNWGEFILERILESSSLEAGKDYVLQGTNQGLKDENGRTQKPDVMINLPEKKCIIIDSKVPSLDHYTQYINAENDEEKSSHLKAFLTAVKSQVNELDERRYQDNTKIMSPEFVMMFIPIEGAYILALEADATLHQYAWNKKVVIVGPSSLFATLMTVSSIWKNEKKNKNTDLVINEVAILYKKIVKFVGYMKDIETNLAKVETAYTSAMKSLATGNGNILGKAEKIRNISGIDAQKKIDYDFDVENDTDDDNLLPPSA